MDYIDFQIIDDKISCTGVYGNKKAIFSLDEAKIFFRVLSKNNYDYKELMINDVKTVRYYGVSKRLINDIRRNRTNTKRRVNRTNKYAGVTVTIGGALSVLLILNSVGLFSGNKIVHSDVTNVEVSSYAKLDSPVEEETKKIDDSIVIPDSVFEFEYEDRSSSDKATLARELYTDVITRNANTYGLPSNLMLAIGTQERGTHSTEVSPGGGFGLFQIQVENGWNWVGKSITAYNYDLGQMETIVVCQREDGTIDVNMLADLEYNTKVACMITAYDLAYCDYDIIAALQTYNSGTSVMSLKKEYGEDWVNHRENLPGDPEYIEHVLSYIPEDNSLLQYKDPSGKEYVVDVNNVYVNSLNKTR